MTKRQHGYQRAEDWEIDQEQERERNDVGGKGQYDGQQDGDKFNRMKF
jgi:hypothetical protein